MKFLCLFALLVGRLCAQFSVDYILDFRTNEIFGRQLAIKDDDYVIHYFKYSWQIIEHSDLSKSFKFVAYSCNESVYESQLGTTIDERYRNITNCDPLSESAAEELGPIDAAELEYYSTGPDAIHNIPVYGPFAKPARPALTTVQPAIPADQQIVFLNGFGNNIVKFDLATFAMTGSITLPSQARVFGVRPTATGPQNEIWTAHAGRVNEISICDLGTQKVLGEIPTPSLDPNNTVPTAIVFTNSGATALYTVSYYTPDSSGNNGALLVFDVVSRTLTSTLALKYGPTAFVMAPDGLTAYLIGAGKIIYYDVLSGTADLVGPFPLLSAGQQVFIHPDGTRLFWNTNYLLNVFDLGSRQITDQFTSGLPSTSAASMRMSQDGAQVFFGNAVGDNVILDTRFGNIVATFHTAGGSEGFGGLPGN